MKRMGFALIAMLLLAGLGRAASDAENDRARREWIDGYQKMEMAAKYLEGKDYDQAYEFYIEAKNIFIAVRSKYPYWNTALLDYRIKHCRASIKTLEVQLKQSNQNVSADDLRGLNANLKFKIKNLNYNLNFPYLEI